MRATTSCGAALVLLLGAGADGCAPAPDTGTAGAEIGANSAGGPRHREVCPDRGRRGEARCFAQIRTDVQGQVARSDAPAGYGPADLQAAYDLPVEGGEGRTVAVVDAYDDPNAESDLAHYRSTFGLPPCTSDDGCFRKVNQDGKEGPYPLDEGWSAEIALDVEMVSAVCPKCKILLVEASSGSTADLGAAVNTAVRLGADVVSNSYGDSEDASVVATAAKYYHHPGVLIAAASGDQGYGVIFPASAPDVIAVGGTSLAIASNPRGFAETVWSSGGSGCSAFIPKPTWQQDTGCARRTVADVAAVGDPDTGVAVYNSDIWFWQHPWVVEGGTSVATPIIAGIFALTGHTGAGASFPYVHPEGFVDVTKGSDGTCSPAYLCTAGAGYDGPTGLGTPDGKALVAIH